jgi:competence protein ComEC
MEAIEENGANVIDAVAGNTYSIGEMDFKILAPLGDNYKDVNDYSVVLRIDYGESSFLMTGDAEKLSESQMLETYSSFDLDCDVLKVGHHGSETSSGANILAKITPEIAIISCGEGNKYGHPRPDVIDRLDDYVGEKLYRTDLVGDIVLVSDGKKITMGGNVLLDEGGGETAVTEGEKVYG